MLEEESFLTNKTTVPLIYEEINEINEKINKFIDNFREGKKYVGELEGIDLFKSCCNILIWFKTRSFWFKWFNLSMAVMRRLKLTEPNLSKVIFNRNVEESKINI